MLSTAPSVTKLAPRKRLLCVDDMKPGDLFICMPHTDLAVALLTHEQIDVKDTQNRWLVVVATQAASQLVVGSMFPVPRDAIVTKLRVVSPGQMIQES